MSSSVTGKDNHTPFIPHTFPMTRTAAEITTRPRATEMTIEAAAYSTDAII